MNCNSQFHSAPNGAKPTNYAIAVRFAMREFAFLAFAVLCRASLRLSEAQAMSSAAKRESRARVSSCATNSATQTRSRRSSTIVKQLSAFRRNCEFRVLNIRRLFLQIEVRKLQIEAPNKETQSNERNSQLTRKIETLLRLLLQRVAALRVWLFVLRFAACCLLRNNKSEFKFAPTNMQSAFLRLLCCATQAQKDVQINSKQSKPKNARIKEEKSL